MNINISVPYTSSNQKTIYEWALDYKALLIKLHKQDSLISRLPREEKHLLRNAVADAEIVLFDTRLCKSARDNASAFEGSMLPSSLQPTPQLWIFSGNEPLEVIAQEPNEEPHICSAQLIFCALGYIRLYSILHPWSPNRLVGCHDTYMGLTIPQKVDEPLSHLFAQFVSCISFMESTIASMREIELPRSMHRRAKHKGIQTARIKVVELRRLASDSEDKQEPSESKFTMQWMVEGHWRKPSPHMKVQRRIWVKSYIKGPADTPMKPSKPTIKVVRR